MRQRKSTGKLRQKSYQALIRIRRSVDAEPARRNAPVHRERFTRRGRCGYYETNTPEPAVTAAPAEEFGELAGAGLGASHRAEPGGRKRVQGSSPTPTAFWRYHAAAGLDAKEKEDTEALATARHRAFITKLAPSASSPSRSCPASTRGMADRMCELLLRQEKPARRPWGTLDLTHDAARIIALSADTSPRTDPFDPPPQDRADLQTEGPTPWACSCPFGRADTTTGQ